MKQKENALLAGAVVSILAVGLYVASWQERPWLNDLSEQAHVLYLAHNYAGAQELYNNIANQEYINRGVDSFRYIVAREGQARSLMGDNRLVSADEILAPIVARMEGQRNCDRIMHGRILDALADLRAKQGKQKEAEELRGRVYDLTAITAHNPAVLTWVSCLGVMIILQSLVLANCYVKLFSPRHWFVTAPAVALCTFGMCYGFYASGTSALGAAALSCGSAMGICFILAFIAAARGVEEGAAAGKTIRFTTPNYSEPQKTFWRS